ncbi:MAG: phosphoribosyltransferase family protein [Pseudomonadales bacterium]
MVNRFFQAFYSKSPPLAVIGQCILCGDCGQPGLDLCRPCSDELPLLSHCCQRCALPLTDGSQNNCGQCLQSPPPFQHTKATWHYSPPIAQLISSFKYNHRYSYGHTLAKIMGFKLASAYTHNNLPDVIIATPLHWYRQLRRGFNQSEQLTQSLAKHLNIPPLRAVKRCKSTPPQQSLNARQRKQNLQGAFTVCADVTGKRLALVDDVMTTGATASEISRCLLKAGAAEIHIWCLARTPS